MRKNYLDKNLNNKMQTILTKNSQNIENKIKTLEKNEKVYC